MTQPIPHGYHTVTPSLTFKDSKKAIEFYKKAFGAEVIDFLAHPSGTGTMHATIKIGNSILMMGDEMPGEESCKSVETLGQSPVNFYVYVADVDAAYQQAVAAGATAGMPVMDMFWGDRAGQVKDPFGHSWMLATHKKDMTNDEIQKGARDFMEKMG